MNIPNQLNNKRGRAAFRSVGFNEKDYVHFNVLQDALSTLNNEQFDQDIFEQLWQQCKLNSQGQTKIDNFIDTVIRAEAILIQKQKQMITAINSVQKKLNNPQIQNQEKMKLQEQLQQFDELKSGFALDLQILRKPFKNFAMDTIYPVANLNYYDENLTDPQMRNSRMTQTAFIPISNKKNMTWIAYISFILCALDFLVALNLTIYMNTVLFLLIFSLYLFEHFDRATIRLLFWGTIFTLIVDILWYCVIAPNLWSLPQNGMWAQFMGGYLKFCVILISLIFIGKMLLVMLLCSEYNIDESRPQQVKILSHTFVLNSKNEDAPLRRLIQEYLPGNKKQKSNYIHSNNPSRIN